MMERRLQIQPGTRATVQKLLQPRHRLPGTSKEKSSQVMFQNTLNAFILSNKSPTNLNLYLLWCKDLSGRT
jgi:hypothetical protein